MTAPAPIFFPNIVQTLVQHFQNAWVQTLLADVPDPLGNTPVPCVVDSEVPNDTTLYGPTGRPVRLVTLFTVPSAGAESPTLSTRRVISQIYERSEFVSGNLAEKVRGVIVDSKYRGIGIKHVKVIGEPAKFPEPGEPYRWQMTADVTIRALAGPWS